MDIFEFCYGLLLSIAVFTVNSANAQKNVKKEAALAEDPTNAPVNRLTKMLLKKHSKKLRPVSQNESLKINVLAALYQIVDVDQRTNLMDISAYFDLWWIDSTLQWNVSEYDNIDVAYLPADEVWTPDLYLYHSIQGSTAINVHHSAVRVYDNGTVRAFVPFTAKAFCPINVKYFPFEKLTCWFDFGSWSYNEDLIKYQVVDQNVSLNDFYDNQEWTLEWARLSNNASVYNNSYFYEIYSTFTLTIFLERGAFYYIFNLIVPSTMVTVVSIIGFHAAANSTQRRESKFRLGIMTLLSMGVLLLNVVDNMPKFSMVSKPGRRGSFSDVPILGLYYLSLILIVSFSSCTSSIFVAMETYAIHNPHEIPCCLKWLTFEWPSFGKRCKRNEYNQISTIKKDNSGEALSQDEGQPSSTNVTPSIALPQPNHTQLSQSDFIGIYPPPLKSQKAKKSPNLEDAQVANKNFERLCDTCANVLSEIKQLRLFFEQEKRSSVKVDRKSSRKTSQIQQKTESTQLLTPLWDRIICRVEYISLTTYLSLIVISLVMFFVPNWY